MDVAVAAPVLSAGCGRAAVACGGGGERGGGAYDDEKLVALALEVGEVSLGETLGIG